MDFLRDSTIRAVARALIGGGGGGEGVYYSYTCVMLDQFLLKSVVIRVNFINIHPLPN